MTAADSLTRIEQIEATQAVPTQVETLLESPRPQREPMNPQDRAVLVGVLGVVLLVGGAVTAWVGICAHGNAIRDRAKSTQVEACTKIRDATAALSCVVEIDR